MFNSSKLIGGQKSSIDDNAIDETINGTASFVLPKITSTPLHHRRSSIFSIATPPKPNLRSPKRYNLSDIATPPRSSNRRGANCSTLLENATGPLLASTNYNLNVSTYIDAKSPGLAARLVQYNEDSKREKHRPTHQPKYGSVGLFPIVHLFKKDLPPLEQTPKRVTVRIARPEFPRFSQEHSKRLAKRNSSLEQATASQLQINENSTRSVLDALKEISRKRLHASEEYDLEESGKRFRSENTHPKRESNKRNRADSPVPEHAVTSPSNQISKKLCMYDEYAASCSSMNFSINLAAAQKSLDTIPEEPKIKVVSVETQTQTIEPPKIIQNIILDKVPIEPVQDESLKPTRKASPLKIFDDKPLERIRKNRLAALMGTLSNKEVVLEPKPKYNTILNGLQADSDTSVAEKSPEKTLVSILSTPEKKPSPSKSDKHVTFNIQVESSENSNEILNEPVTSSLIISPPIAPISATIPISTSILSISNSNINLGKPITQEINTTSLQSITAVPSVISYASTAAPAIPSTTAMNLTKPISEVAPVISFGVAPIVSASEAKLASPPKFGGFKFDLAKPAAPQITSKVETPFINKALSTFAAATTAPTFAAPTVTTTSSYSFGSNAKPATSTVNAEPNKIAPTFGAANMTFSFGANASKPPMEPDIVTSKPAFGIAVSNSSSFSPAKPAAVATTTASLFGAAFPTANPVTTVSSIFGAAPTTGTTVASGGISTTNALPAFKFAPSNKSALTFGGSTAPANSSLFKNSFNAAPSTFGTAAITTATSSFSTTGSFNSAPSFGSAVTTTTPSLFGTATPPSFGAAVITTTPSAFGTATPPSFGSTMTTTAPSTFGTAAPPSFGSVVTTTTPSAFGTATPPTFGAAAVTTPAPSGFGVQAVTTTASSMFGAGSFGAKSNSFGAATNNMFAPSTQTAKNLFGAPPTPAFNAPITTASSFGTTAPPQFGAKTTASLFGSANTATPSFGTSNSFSGASGFKANGSSFGSTSSTFSSFGSATAAAPAAPSFASANNATFGSNSFSAGATPNGSASFGAPTAAPSNSFTFGGAPSNNTAAPSSFGSASFGSAAAKPPSFGAAAPAANNSSGVYNFGGAVSATVAPNNSGVFAFGSNLEAPKPSFNFTAGGGFGGGGAAPPAFGAGGAAPPAFGAGLAPQFNTPPATPGTFSIGAGPSARPRTQLKAKRRT